MKSFLLFFNVENTVGSVLYEVFVLAAIMDWETKLLLSCMAYYFIINLLHIDLK